MIRNHTMIRNHKELQRYRTFRECFFTILYKPLFFSIWPWPCQLSSWTQPIYAIFRTQNKQGRFIQLNLYRCMYFCQTKLLKLLSSLLVPQSRSRKVKLSLKSTYHPSFLTYKIFLWWLKRNIQLMPQKCFEQLHSWLITHKWRHISWHG